MISLRPGIGNTLRVSSEPDREREWPGRGGDGHPQARSEERSRPRPGWIGRSARAMRRADAQPSVVELAARLRRVLPGDSRFGDPLSTAGPEASALMGRTLTGLSSERPSVLRELGLGALQVWQSLSEAQGRGRGEHEVTLVFTDLVGFSSWALEAGDAAAVELLREVGFAVEGAVADHDGTIVKRLGDGVMAAFSRPADAVAATRDALSRLRTIEVDGYRPRMRAGIHRGCPRKLGGDYLGRDVNIAARVAQAARADEILISDSVAVALEGENLDLGPGKRLKAQGAPRDLRVHTLR